MKAKHFKCSVKFTKAKFENFMTDLQKFLKSCFANVLKPKGIVHQQIYSVATKVHMDKINKM